MKKEEKEEEGEEQEEEKEEFVDIAKVSPWGIFSSTVNIYLEMSTLSRGMALFALFYLLYVFQCTVCHNNPDV